MGRPILQIPIDTLIHELRLAATVIIRADGDRDYMNPSDLTVQQTIAVYDLLMAAVEKLSAISK